MDTLSGRKNKQFVSDYLKEKILFLEWLPGTPINDVEVAHELNVSRTPVREALLILQQENLVDIYPQRGTFVSKMDLPRLREIAYLRQIVEYEIIRTSAARKVRLSDIVEQSLFLQERAIRMGDVKGYVMADRMFHRELMKACDHEYVWELISPKFLLVSRFQMLFFTDLTERMTSSLEEHKKIVDCIDNQRQKELEEILAIHYSCINDCEMLLEKYADHFIPLD